LGRTHYAKSMLCLCKHLTWNLNVPLWPLTHSHVTSYQRHELCVSLSLAPIWHLVIYKGIHNHWCCIQFVRFQCLNVLWLHNIKCVCLWLLENVDARKYNNCVVCYRKNVVTLKATKNNIFSCFTSWLYANAVFDDATLFPLQFTDLTDMWDRLGIYPVLFAPAYKLNPDITHLYFSNQLYLYFIST